MLGVFSLSNDNFGSGKWNFCSFQNEELARDAILLFFSTHIDAIKNIYMTTTFETYDHTMAYTGVTFAVQRTTVRFFKQLAHPDADFVTNT